MIKLKRNNNLLTMAIILSMGATFLTPITAHASTHTWQAVGSAGFSADQVYATKIATDRSGTPYVVYADVANGSKATVMKYDGSNWTTVGNPGFSTYTINSDTNIAIAIDSSGTPYVAIVDFINGSTYPPVVMKYTGSGSTGWEEVGSGYLTEGNADYVSIAIGSDDKPYVVYRDFAINGGAATVKKYDGTNWVSVGSPGFSVGGAFYTSIAMDGNTPYVAYQDYGNSDQGSTVMKYTGNGSTGWETVGTEDFSNCYASQVSIAIDVDGNPYVAYNDVDDHYGNGFETAVVMKFNGSSWEAVGNAGASGDRVDDLSIAIGANGKPYFEYTDSEDCPIVMKYNGNNWEKVGGSYVTSDYVYYTSMIIGVDGNPYIVYSDGNSQKATVMTIEEDKDITGVNSLTDITVANGTAENSIGLPETVDVTLSDSTTTSAAVTWDNGTPTYDGNTAGTYTFTGTLTLPDGVLNPNNYTASINVIVQAASSPTRANAGNNSIRLSSSSVTAGNSVTITAEGDMQSALSNTVGNVDKDECFIPVEWSSDDGTTGSFTLSGGSYTASYIPSTAGSHTIEVVFQLYYWDGNRGLWEGYESGDTKSTTLTVNSAAPVVDPPVVNNETTPAAVTIQGTKRVGETLTAQLKDEDGNNFTTSAAVTYEWYRLDNEDSDFIDQIRTGRTCTLTGNEVNKYIGVRAIYGDYSFDDVIGRISAASSSSSHHHHSTTTDTETNTETKKNDNIKKTGWTDDINDAKYYLKEDGSKTTGWKLIDNTWYFFNNRTGAMIRGWYKSEAGDWTFDKNDTVGQWFHLNTDGKLTLGWYKDTADGNWYYLCSGNAYGALGVMLTGWQKIDGNWYYFNTNGVMASNAVVDGYTIGANGAWIE